MGTALRRDRSAQQPAVRQFTPSDNQNTPEPLLPTLYRPLRQQAASPRFPKKRVPEETGRQCDAADWAGPEGSRGPA